MVQEFQVKKSKKWACKLCGEKQSLLKVYGQGSGSDCRHHVQKLNLLQGQVEQAATGSASKACQNVISDDDIDDETKQSLLIPQEPASMSRWNKYLEEKIDGTREEEEDREHYYSHQDCESRTVRKRMHLPYDAGDFCNDGIKENISKKKKIYEGGNPSEACKFSCKITGDLGCLEWQDKPISPTLPLKTSSDTFLMNKSAGRFEQCTSSTASYLKREPKMDTISNHSELRKKIEPDCSVTSSRYVLPNEESTTTNRLSAQKISFPGLHQSDLQSDIILKTSSSVSIQKPGIQCNLFQTDDDFDENY